MAARMAQAWGQDPLDILGGREGRERIDSERAEFAWALRMACYAVNLADDEAMRQAIRDQGVNRG